VVAPVELNLLSGFADCTMKKIVDPQGVGSGVSPCSQQMMYAFPLPEDAEQGFRNMDNCFQDVHSKYADCFDYDVVYLFGPHLIILIFKISNSGTRSTILAKQG
jgi:hypothetical protein